MIRVQPAPGTPSTIFPSSSRTDLLRINYYSDQGLIIITLPGLPHELMANFDNAMMQSLVLQGFLWPGWGSQWLGSCRTARISLSHGRTLRKIEPDGGLQILSQTLPFLLVEVADSQEYGDVLKKASWVLRHSNGKIRFAVLIKLVGKSVKERREEMNRGKRVLSDMDEGPMDTIKRARTHGSNSLSSVGSPQPTSGCFESTGTSQHVPGSSPPAEIHSDSSDLSSVASANFTGDQYLGLPTANPPPTLAPDSDVDSATSSDATPATGDPSSPSSPTIPFNPRAAFSSAFVTVLGTTLTGTRRNVTTLLDCIEFWPRRPGPDDVFTFGWEDMPAPRFPDVMRGRTFKVGFEELHQTLDVFVKTGDPAWVREHGEEVLGEWEDGGSSETRGSGSGDEDDDEDEEEEEEEGGESDGEYCG